MGTATLQPLPTDIERVLIGGDLAQLKPEQRLSYYNHLCESLGLNPLTKPFQYLTLSGKTVLYATKDCTEQLRNNKAVSVRIMAREVVEGCYVVTAQASLPSGRCDESIGAVPIENLKGESRSNAMMKCETKAKRRVTLSICGLGMLDESEVDSIPGARPAFADGPQEVAERRIKELAARKPTLELETAVDPSYEERHKALILETERRVKEIEAQKAALKAKAEDANKTYEERHRAVIIEAAEALDQPRTAVPIRKRGDISYKALEAFSAMKKILKEASDGTDTLYYECLQAAGVGHADELSTKAGKEVYKTMLAIQNRLKQDKALKLEVETHALRIGASELARILGVNGFSDVEEFLANANGVQVDGLLRDLREAK